MRPALQLAAVLLLNLTVLDVRSTEANLFKSNAGDLDALCRGDQVDLRTIPHLMKLVKQPTTSGDECQLRVKEALSEMWRIAQERTACTMEKAQNITNFVDEFLKSKTDENGQDQPELPRPLVRFAIAYGMKVSFICRKHMMYKFHAFAWRRLAKRYAEKDGQLELVHLYHYLADVSPVSLLLSPLIKPGEILLPSDLFQVVPDLDKKMGEFLSNSKALKSLKSLCSNSLEPLYRPILMPIAHLNRAGFNYRDSAFKRNIYIGNFLFDIELQSRFWSSVVFLCETAKMIEVVEEKDQTVRKENEAIESELIKVVVESEMKLKVEADDLPSKLFQNPITHYVPDEIVGDKILGHYDFSLKAKVKSFDANKDEIQRIREQIMKRSFDVFKMMSRKGTHWPLIKKFFKRLVFKKGNDEELKVAVKGLHDLMDKAEDSSLVYGFKFAGAWILKAIPVIFAYIILFSGVVFTALFKSDKQGHLDKFGLILTRK